MNIRTPTLEMEWKTKAPTIYLDKLIVQICQLEKVKERENHQPKCILDSNITNQNTTSAALQYTRYLQLNYTQTQQNMNIKNLPAIPSKGSILGLRQTLYKKKGTFETKSRHESGGAYNPINQGGSLGINELS